MFQRPSFLKGLPRKPQYLVTKNYYSLESILVYSQFHKKLCVCPAGKKDRNHKENKRVNKWSAV